MSVVQLQPKLTKKNYSYLEVIPLQGKKTKYELNRTRYFLNGDFSADLHRCGCTINLPTLKDDEFSYELELSPTSRLRSLGNSPFMLNGQSCFDALLKDGDRIWLGGNQILLTTENEQKGGERSSIQENQLMRVSETEIPILIEGETGSGKSSLAKVIHTKSLRARGEFVALNLAALPVSLLESELFGHVRGAFTGAISDKQGVIRSAHRGTLFLDEIDSLPKEIQLKLLLFLDSSSIKPVGSDRWVKCDVRLIFASGQKWKQLVNSSTMRKDFFYRLNTAYKLQLPALRENRELIKNYLENFKKNRSIQFSNRLSEFYMQYRWSGNYRELRGHLEKKFYLRSCDLLDLDELDKELIGDIDPALEAVEDMGMNFEQLKEYYFRHIFYRHHRNYKKASVALRVSERTVRSCLCKNQGDLRLVS